jgi:penicillin-binding protein 1A
MRRIGEMDQATAVFDDKDHLAFTIFKEQRIDVQLSAVSPNLTKAITSIEDQRFFEHHGFDLVRIASAAFANVRHNRRAQGGSTITQQLARQSFLTPNKSYRRKMQELILAARLERLYTKPQILELYFNKVYFGDGLYGVEAASRGYFGKHASEVSVAEAALLAGLVKSPSSYAPTVSMERAIARRNTVLQAMLENGAIDRATYQSARASKAALHDTLREEEPHGQYFKEQVRQELVNRFGWQRVYQGGLRVFSTIDMPMQLAAETAIADQIASIETRRASWQARRAAARQKAGQPAAADPRTSSRPRWLRSNPIPTSAGDGRWPRLRRQPLNRAVQAHRQAGSSFAVRPPRRSKLATPATVLDHLDDPIATPRGRGRRRTSTPRPRR